MKKAIGIIGQGFVGATLYDKFKNHYSVLTFDIDNSKSNSTLGEVKNCNIIFLCLPTPMDIDGSCDLSIVEKVINQIDEPNKILVIKSTVIPGSTEYFNKKYKSDFIFNPEFLREKYALSDFEKQTHIFLGGSKKNAQKIKSIYLNVFKNKTIVLTDSLTAEMVKYTINTFLATKVSFANEINQLCKKLSISYNELIKLSKFDKRIGESHWDVPGHDGDYGFGGHCLPKDLSALINLTNQLESTNNILKAVNETNNKVRTNRDWEKMIGRAVKSKI